MGASSTFQMTQQPSPVMSDPPPVYSFLPSNTPGAFIAQKPKSTTKGINANPPIKGYVFGKGQHGWGYYKIGTEEAYNVLQNRLGKQIETLQANICPSCFCCGILCCEDSNTKKLRDLEKAKAELEARRDRKLRKTESENETDTGYMGAACGVIVDAAACGSGPAACCGQQDGSGGSCGGGSCGAASCGASACGSASCDGGGGGGGCGGGGCGGGGGD